VSGISILVAGQLLMGNSSLDIHLHDTLYVFPAAYYSWFPALLLLSCWLLYICTKRILYSKKISRIHIILTIPACFFIAALPYILTSQYQGLAGMPGRYFDYGASSRFNVPHRLTTTGTIVFIILIAAQLLYVINFAIGLFKYFAKQ
jgi:cytochrome c oxidase subunit 1